MSITVDHESGDGFVAGRTMYLNLKDSDMMLPNSNIPILSMIVCMTFQTKTPN